MNAVSTHIDRVFVLLTDLQIVAQLSRVAMVLNQPRTAAWSVPETRPSIVEGQTDSVCITTPRRFLHPLALGLVAALPPLFLL